MIESTEHPTDSCACTECSLRRALERSMAEVERLTASDKEMDERWSGIAARLRSERDQARADLAKAQKVVEAAKEWREKYYEPAPDDPEEGCTCGMIDFLACITPVKMLDAILRGEGPKCAVR